VILALMGVVVVAFPVVVLFGLVTGRIDWRQQSCCQGDPTKDARMRVPDDRHVQPAVSPTDPSTRRQQP
jgi:hypothetical protein